MDCKVEQQWLFPDIPGQVDLSYTRIEEILSQIVQDMNGKKVDPNQLSLFRMLAISQEENLKNKKFA